MKLQPVFVAAALFATSFLRVAVARDLQMYECVAQKQLAGREEAKADSQQLRMADGALRYLDKGTPGYVGVEKGKPVPEWLELFGALHGHGSSFLGFYLSNDFKCAPADG